MRNSGQRSRSRWIFAGLTSSLLLACLAQFLPGPQLLRGQGATSYFVVPYDAKLMVNDPDTGQKKLDEREVKSLQQLKSSVIIGTAGLSENRERFALWYSYVLRSFTHPDQASKLPEKRKDILDDMRRAKLKEVRDSVLNQTVSFVNVYIQGKANGRDYNFHPAVRYNALLLLGDLNSEEAVPPQRYPTPYQPALPILIAEYKKPAQIDALRLAAMIGMLRHVQLDRTRPEATRMLASQRNEITQLMVALVSAKDPGPGTTKQGHGWLQRRGLDVLGALGVVGVDEAATRAVTGLLRDTNAELNVRLAAAATLALIPPNAQPKTMDVAEESNQLGALLVQACQRELARIDEFQKKSQPPGMSPYGMDSGYGGDMGGMPGYGDGTMSGMPGGDMSAMSAYGDGTMSGMPGGMPGGDMSGYGGMGYGMAGPKDPQLDLFRRLFKYDVACIQAGLNGIARLAPANSPQAAAIKKISDEVQQVSKTTDPPPNASTLVMLHKSVKDSLTKLETMTASAMPKKKPAEASPVSPASDVPVAVNTAVSSPDTPTPAPTPAAVNPAAPTRPGTPTKAGTPANVGTVPVSAPSGTGAAAAPPG